MLHGMTFTLATTAQELNMGIMWNDGKILWADGGIAFDPDCCCEECEECVNCADGFDCISEVTVTLPELQNGTCSSCGDLEGQDVVCTPNIIAPCTYVSSELTTCPGVFVVVQFADQFVGSKIGVALVNSSLVTFMAWEKFYGEETPIQCTELLDESIPAKSPPFIGTYCTNDDDNPVLVTV